MHTGRSEHRTNLVEGPDGVPLHVHELGGDGPPLVMAHATGLHGGVFGPVAAHLPGWRRVAVDLRGHGDSPLPSGDELRWEGFGRDVRCIAEHLGGQVLGVGHSLGGVAMLMAALAAPELFSALVLYEPAMRMERGERSAPLLRYQRRMERSAADRRPRFPSRASALAAYAAKRPFDQLQAAVLHAYVEHGFRETAEGDVELKCLPATESQVFEQTHNHDVLDRIDRIDLPVVVVRGSDTTPLQAQSADALAAAFGGPVVNLDGAGHFGPLEQPARFAAVIRENMGEPAV